MMSRQILFQDIPNTTSHHALKMKCETDTNQGNICAIATILSLLFFIPEVKCMQHLVGIFAVFPYVVLLYLILLFMYFLLSHY
jgi:hypothetical protein